MSDKCPSLWVTIGMDPVEEQVYVLGWARSAEEAVGVGRVPVWRREVAATAPRIPEISESVLRVGGIMEVSRGRTERWYLRTVLSPH